MLGDDRNGNNDDSLWSSLMAITALYENSASISTTEYSLPNVGNYNVANVKTHDGVFQVFLDLNAMVAGDQYELRILEMVQAAGTARVIVVYNFVGVQAAPHTALPSFIFMHGWDVTLKRLAGADRTIAWSIRQVA
jgi:hypothetical protein